MIRLFTHQAYRRVKRGVHVRIKQPTKFLARHRYGPHRARYHVIGEAAVPSWNVSVLLQPGAAWIGAHWSKYNRRLCINLLPFLTVAITFTGGTSP